MVSVLCVLLVYKCSASAQHTHTARANTHIHTPLLNTHLTHSDEMYVYACARACVLMGGRQGARGWWSQGGQEGGRECSRTKERRQKKKEKGRRR
jgi:hypothetical protein